MAGLALFACHGQSTADASGEVLGQTASALSSASIKWLNGTYGAGCTNRSGVSVHGLFGSVSEI
jgi:hypothetical protein